ncbi:MAG TPA: hypothetical protein VKA90_01955, partial [Beijerinckiaceae bacterium]|nr:hypothetical protein [Beijerinckiaceae bacterium]
AALGAGPLPRMEGGSGGIAAALRQMQGRHERRSCAGRRLDLVSKRATADCPRKCLLRTEAVAQTVLKSLLVQRWDEDDRIRPICVASSQKERSLKSI